MLLLGRVGVLMGAGWGMRKGKRRERNGGWIGVGIVLMFITQSPVQLTGSTDEKAKAFFPRSRTRCSLSPSRALSAGARSSQLRLLVWSPLSSSGLPD